MNIEDVLSKFDLKICNLRGVNDLKGYPDLKSYDIGSGLQILNSELGIDRISLFRIQRAKKESLINFTLVFGLLENGKFF